MISLKGFRVMHGDKVLNALALMEITMPDNMDYEKRDITTKPKFLDVLAINTDGNIVSIRDEAWTFQFVPIVTE